MISWSTAEVPPHQRGKDCQGQWTTVGRGVELLNCLPVYKSKTCLLFSNKLLCIYYVVYLSCVILVTVQELLLQYNLKHNPLTISGFPIRPSCFYHNLCFPKSVFKYIPSYKPCKWNKVIIWCFYFWNTELLFLYDFPHISVSCALNCVNFIYKPRTFKPGAC